MNDKQRDGDYVIDASGWEVDRCVIDFAFSLVFARDGDEERAKLVIETPFSCRFGGGPIQTFDPAGDVTGLGPALQLLRKTVKSAVASEEGDLRMEFSDGSQLEVPQGPDFEAWNWHDPTGAHLIGAPDGLAVFMTPRSG